MHGHTPAGRPEPFRIQPRPLVTILPSPRRLRTSKAPHRHLSPLSIGRRRPCNPPAHTRPRPAPVGSFVHAGSTRRATKHRCRPAIRPGPPARSGPVPIVAVEHSERSAPPYGPPQSPLSGHSRRPHHSPSQAVSCRIRRRGTRDQPASPPRDTPISPTPPRVARTDSGRDDRPDRQRPPVRSKAVDLRSFSADPGRQCPRLIHKRRFFRSFSAPPS